MRLVGVAVPVPLRRLFEYEVPAALERNLAVGTRIKVPFGRREMIAVVVEAPYAAAPPAFDCKPVTAAIDGQPLLPVELLDLCRWVADYYQHPLGEVLATALPGPLRRDETPAASVEAWFRLTEAGRDALVRLPPRAVAQRRVLTALAAAPLPRARLLSQLPNAAAGLRQTLARHWIETCRVLPTFSDTQLAEPRPALSDEQSLAMAALGAAAPGFGATLLDGVTGSGKTELYLRLTAEVLAAGKQVLVLAPEIGLTPQLVERFKARFGVGVVSFHSGISEAARARVWLAARDGEARVIVGTRSAVFLPMSEPGLIVVDEEHDISYKQQDGLRYAARDVAVLRARRLGIPIVLGSATPSLESLHNARIGRYRHLRLRQRVHAAAPPRIALLDVRHRPLENGLSETLMEGVERHVTAGNQALLFLNRRGYAPVLLCHDCGRVTPCPHCDARLVLHRRRKRLVCHHCGHVAPIPAACAECGSGELLPVGQGTERIEDALRLRFPAARIERVDSDRLRSAAQMEKLFADVKSGAVEILVGTQVLAKGHDFAGLTFAGLIDVDQALFGTDFRALERMGQLVTQVAGRVGRAGQPGEVILQTHQPEHPLLKQLVDHGYPAFADTLLRERQEFALPPYSSLAVLRAEARREDIAAAFLRNARDLLSPSDEVEALGPAPATMARRAGYHRAQLLLKSGSRAMLHKILADWLPQLETLTSGRRTRWSLDVDPADLF